MSRRRGNNRRDIEVFSLSFLDVVSCGFGAIILLLVISKISQPIILQQTTTDLKKVIIELEQQHHVIRGNIKTTHINIQQSAQQLEELHSRQKTNSAALSTIKGQYENITDTLNAQTIIKNKLNSAHQTLTEEMRRLQQNKPIVNKNNTIAGLSVNSEYIIFIIDTSGSMKNFAWSSVRKKMREILKVHPSVKGVQVLNDMGDYMFSQYAGKWIKDTPARRRIILKRIASWQPFSNSSPEEGIIRAIKTFSAENKQISLYIFGDDFSRGSIQSVIDTVDKLNHSSRSKAKKVQINAIGFPVLFNQPGSENNINRFSALMRKLAENNNGSFIGLNGLK